MNPKLRKIIFGLLLAVFMISTALLVQMHFHYSQGNDSYSEAERIAASSQDDLPALRLTGAETRPSESAAPALATWAPAPVVDDPNMEALKDTDLAALREVNEDVVGWITIPDTNVNYPLMQGEDNEYYLEHTWDNDPNDVGSIFLECQNSPDLTDFNTIIYGHNMGDASMFSNLHYYAYPDYASTHPYVYIVTDRGVCRYEVFSSYLADVQSNTYGLSFRQEATRYSFLEMALENSEIDFGISPAITDRIITLSTCSGWGYETRRVVHARLKMIEVTSET